MPGHAAAHVHGRSPLYPVYATNARDAAGPDLSRPCTLCRDPLRAGERIADLSEGGLGHVPCIAWQRTRGGYQ